MTDLDKWKELLSSQGVEIREEAWMEPLPPLELLGHTSGIMLVLEPGETEGVSGIDDQDDVCATIIFDGDGQHLTIGVFRDTNY